VSHSVGGILMNRARSVPNSPNRLRIFLFLSYFRKLPYILLLEVGRRKSPHLSLVRSLGYIIVVRYAEWIYTKSRLKIPHPHYALSERCVFCASTGDLIIHTGTEGTGLRGRMGPPRQRQGPVREFALYCRCLSVIREDIECYGVSRPSANPLRTQACPTP